MNIRKCNIPIDESILADKKFKYEVYLKLQIDSNWNELDEHRYIRIDSINLTAWSLELGLCTKTIKRALRHLEEIRFLKKFTNDDGIEFYKIPNKFERYCLINIKMANKLLDLREKNIIKLYLIYYNYNRVYGTCYRSQGAILKEMGYNAGSGKNLDMLRYLRNTLEEQGLISIKRVYKREFGKTMSLLEIQAPEYTETSFYKK